MSIGERRGWLKDVEREVPRNVIIREDTSKADNSQMYIRVIVVFACTSYIEQSGLSRYIDILIEIIASNFIIIKR